jgi:hypothetical protein
MNTAHGLDNMPKGLQRTDINFKSSLELLKGWAFVSIEQMYRFYCNPLYLRLYRILERKVEKKKSLVLLFHLPQCFRARDHF